MRPLPDTIKNVIWIQTGFLGDIIIQTAAISVLRRQRPDIKQILITTGLGVSALRGHSELAGLICFDKRGPIMDSFRNVRSEVRELIQVPRETMILQAHRSFRSSLLARYLGYYTVTYYETQWSFLSQMRCQRVAVLHEAHRIGLLLEVLGVDREAIVAGRPFIDELPFEGEKEWLSLFEKDKRPIIAIAPGSVWGTKKWPQESYSLLVKKILTEFPECLVLLLGSGQEIEVCQAIVGDCKEDGNEGRLWNLAGQTSLDDLRGIYPRLTILVANDSSPIHYASAFNVPTIAIFGATVPAMGFGPLAEGSVTLGLKDLDCRPCSDHGPKTCPLGHFKCMKDLGVGQVFDHCRRQLSG